MLNAIQSASGGKLNRQFILMLGCLMLLIAGSSLADEKIKLRLHQPPPNKLGAGELWKLDITNTTNEDIAVYLTGSATEEKDGLLVDGKSKVFTVKPGKKTYGYNDFKEGEVNWKNKSSQEAILRTGNVKSGSYTICVTAFYEDGSVADNEQCITQLIENKSTAMIMPVSPADGEEIDPDTLPGLMFSWKGIGTDGPYELIIVEIRGEQSEDIAIKENRPFFEQKEIKGNSFQYPVTGPKFDMEKKYVWMMKSGDVESEVYKFGRTMNSNRSVLSQTLHIEDACTHVPLANWPVNSGCASQHWQNFTDQNGDVTIINPPNSCIPANITYSVGLNGATSVTPTGNIRYVTAPFVVDFKINGRLVSASSSFNFNNLNYNGSGTIPLVNMTTYSISLQYRVTLYPAPPPNYTATTAIWSYGWNSTFPTELYTHLPATPNNLTYLIKLEAKNSCGDIKTIIGGFTYNSAPPPPCTSCANNIIVNSGFNTGSVPGNTGLVAGNMFPAAGGSGSAYKWTCYRSALARSTMGYCDNGYVAIYGSKTIQSFLIQKAVPFVPSTSYTVKFWARKSGSTTPDAQIKCFAYNTSLPNPSTPVGISTPITSTTWSQYTITFIAPIGATKFAFCPTNENNSSQVSARSWIDIDNICLEKNTVPSVFAEDECYTDFTWSYDWSTGETSFSVLPNDNGTSRHFKIAKVPKCGWVGPCKVGTDCPWRDAFARHNVAFNNNPNYTAYTPGPGWTNPIVDNYTTPDIDPTTYFTQYWTGNIGNPINSYGNSGYWYILWIGCPNGVNGTGKTYILSECTPRGIITN